MDKVIIISRIASYVRWLNEFSDIHKSLSLGWYSESINYDEGTSLSVRTSLYVAITHRTLSIECLVLIWRYGEIIKLRVRLGYEYRTRDGTSSGSSVGSSVILRKWNTLYIIKSASYVTISENYL